MELGGEGRGKGKGGEGRGEAGQGGLGLGGVFKKPGQSWVIQASM